MRRAGNAGPRRAACRMRRAAPRPLGRNDEALAAAGESVRIKPEDSTGHGMRASILQTMGRIEDALAAAGESVRLEPESAAGRAIRDSILRDLGRTA